MLPGEGEELQDMIDKVLLVVLSVIVGITLGCIVSWALGYM